MSITAWIAHEEGRALLGELPENVRVEVWSDPASPPSDAAQVHFWTPGFLGGRDGWIERLGDLTGLQVVQLLSAGAEAWVGHIPDGVALHNARGVHDAATAEWAVTATLAYLRGFPAFTRAQDRRQWANPALAPTDTLTGKRVLILGAGSIGHAIGARLAPFEVELTYVARTARPEQGVHGVEELPALLPYADVVEVIVPHTAATVGLVDAAFLAALPDGALLVNAARGSVVEPGALYKELASGRIGAALDVTEPEPLPADDPLWTLPNVLITPHVGGSVRGLMPRIYRYVGDQLRRFAAGEPLRNRITGAY